MGFLAIYTLYCHNALVSAAVVSMKFAAERRNMVQWNQKIYRSSMMKGEIFQATKTTINKII